MHSTTFFSSFHQHVHSSTLLLARQISHRQMQPLWSCDKSLSVKWCTTLGPVLHLGRCCGTPVWEPAGRGRGRRDAVATQHRLTTGAPVMLQSAGPQNEPVCCNMTSTELSRMPPVHQHPRLKGERLLFCAPLLRKSIAINLQPTLLFPMHQKRGAASGRQFGCFCTLS